MNSVEIARVLSKDVHAKRVFRGVFSRDKLPRHVNTRRSSAYIVNTDSSDGAGKHWVAVWLDGRGKGEYFDSFGLPPQHREIERFILRHSHTCRYNQRLLQDITSSACGLYVLYYVIMKSRGASLMRVLSVFDPHRPQTNDRRVLRMIRPYFLSQSQYVHYGI